MHAPRPRHRFSLFGLGRRFVRTRTFKVAVAVLAVLAVAAVVADRAFDRPLRRIVERRLNEQLVGYHASVGRTDFHLIGFALELERTILVQNAHPDPPVMDLPRLRMSVHWTDLLTGHLVADAEFDSPRLHMNLVQLQEENKDSLPLGEHGWQRALESIYPLKINVLTINYGSIVYQDASGFDPLRLSNVHLVARNIRNIRSRDRVDRPVFAQGACAGARENRAGVQVGLCVAAASTVDGQPPARVALMNLPFRSLLADSASVAVSL